MTLIKRNTQVVSVSLPPKIVRALDKDLKKQGLSRSAFMRLLIEKELEDKRWSGIYKKGREVGEKFNITSEADIDRILHEAS